MPIRDLVERFRTEHFERKHSLETEEVYSREFVAHGKWGIAQSRKERGSAACRASHLCLAMFVLEK